MYTGKCRFSFSLSAISAQIVKKFSYWTYSLQIDFVDTIKLEGIQIFNWKRENILMSDDNSDLYGRGIYSFKVKFGNESFNLQWKAQVNAVLCYTRKHDGIVLSPCSELSL